MHIHSLQIATTGLSLGSNSCVRFAATLGLGPFKFDKLFGVGGERYNSCAKCANFGAKCP